MTTAIRRVSEVIESGERFVLLGHQDDVLFMKAYSPPLFYILFLLIMTGCL